MYVYQLILILLLGNSLTYTTNKGYRFSKSYLSNCIYSLLVIITATSNSYDTHQLFLHLKLDHLVQIVLIGIYLISLYITSYAHTAMRTDKNRKCFMCLINLIPCCVTLFVMSADLITAFIGWVAIGVNLYYLLRHYHCREALRAAKRKFIVSRIGDCFFLAAVMFTWHSLGTTDFAQLSKANEFQSNIIMALLIIAILTRSAQFPFHRWLPETLHTPTPVSAMMHAGVVNSGGILLAKTAMLIVHTPDLMLTLTIIGCIGLFWGGIMVNYEPSIKKGLAYSTMSQMGFMTIQCSMGNIAGAIFHLIMHGFYKSWAFLNSGDTLTKSRSKNIKLSLYIPLLLSIFIFNILLTHLIFTDKYDLGDCAVLVFFIAFTLTDCIYATICNLYPRGLVMALCCSIFMTVGYFFTLKHFYEFINIYYEPMMVNQYLQIGALILAAIGILVIKPDRFQGLYKSRAFNTSLYELK